MEPFYIRHSDLIIEQENASFNALELCSICDHHVPRQIIGAQYTNGIWALSMRTQDARAFMLNDVKELDFSKKKVELYDKYPTSKIVPNEKILFKDFPFSVSDNELLDYLNNQPGIHVKTGMIAGRLRDKSNKLTQFLSGDVQLLHVFHESVQQRLSQQ